MFSNKDILGMIFPIWIRVLIVVVILLVVLGIKEVVDIVRTIF